MNFGCGCGPYYGRRYLTKDERLSLLKEYKKGVENELKVVEERLRELEKGE